MGEPSLLAHVLADVEGTYMAGVGGWAGVASPDGAEHRSR